MKLVNKKSVLKRIEECGQSNDLKDIEALQNDVIQSESPELIYEFAKQVEGADILKLQDALIECYTSYVTNDGWKCLYNFANIECVDLAKLQKDFLDRTTWDYKNIVEFAMKVKDCDVALLQDELLFFIKEIVRNKYDYDSEDVIKYVVKFTKNVKGCDFQKIQNTIFKLAIPQYIYYFALKSSNVDINKAEKEFIKACKLQDDYSYVPEFAANIKGANIGKLQELVIKFGCTDDLINFKAMVIDRNAQKLENAIKANSDADALI